MIRRQAGVRTVLRIACLSVLVIILWAGLWPFHAPANEIAWISGANGLRFGRHAIALSSRPLSISDEPCSLEIWLRPRFVDESTTFFATYRHDNPRQFGLRQYHSALVLERGEANSPGSSSGATMGVGDVFRKGKAAFLTITSDTRGTSIYVDGAWKESSPFRFSGSDLIGQLLFGDSAEGPSSWSGDLLGFAIYSRALTPAETAHHFQTWTKEGRPDISNSSPATALYLFQERNGAVIHDEGQERDDLVIPQHFAVAHKLRLQSAWSEFKPSPEYWRAVAVNVCGFIPFGFVFYAYFATVRQAKASVLRTIVAGALVSFTIEFLQGYLPTRDSGTTDIITNTLGTWIGVMVYPAKTADAILGEIL